MIDTMEIRCRILELAFEGKLSSHMNGDDSVEDMLLSNKIKSFNEEKGAPYDIPKHWKWVRLSELYDINPKVNANDSDDAAFVPMERISAGFNNMFSYEIQSWKQASKNHTKFMNGDVCLAKISPCFENRKSFVADDLPNSIGGGTTELIVLRQQAMNPLYTYYIVNDRRFIHDGSASYKGIVGQQRVKSDIIKNFLVPVPPYKEQSRIVETIKHLFQEVDKIDQYQSQYAFNLEILKSKLIDAGIRGKLTEQLPEDGNVEGLYEEIKIGKAKILEKRKGREDKKIKTIENDMPFEIPSHWKWIRLGDIGLFKKGPFGSALTKSLFVQKGEDTVKVYEQQHAIKKNSELGTYYITREYFVERMNGFEVMPGDIIISCAGTIGETYIMPDEIEQGIINQALMRVTLAEGINKKFFQYFFDANLKKSAQKESNGSAIKNIPPFDVLKNWYFPLTSIEEQGRIVEKIDALLNFLD